MNIVSNGLSTKNSSREERWQETERHAPLQQQACKDSGVSSSKKDRIIYIENSSNVRQPFLIREVSTVEELLLKLYQKYPELLSEYLELRIYPSRFGTMQRKEIKNELPLTQEDLYIYLSLRKHPPMHMNKIE